MADQPADMRLGDSGAVPQGPTVSAAVEQMLRRIAPRVGKRRVWLFHRSAPDNVDVYSPDDSSPSGAVSPAQAAALIAPWQAALQRGETVQVSAATLAPARKVGRLAAAALARHGIGQCLLVPAIEHGQLAAVLCVEGPQVTARRLAYLSEILDLIVSTLSLRAAETARIETSRLLTTITGTLPVLIFEVDAAGRYIGFFSGPRELMLGDPDDFLGRQLDEVLPADLAARFHDVLARTLENGATSGLEYHLDLPVGRRHFDLSTARKAPAVPGEAPTALFLIHDVTERHRQQIETGRLQRVVHVTENHVIRVDAQGRITWVNPSFERRTGRSLGEMQGRALIDGLLAPPEAPTILQDIEAAMAEGRPCAGQVIRLGHSGEELWMKFNLQPLAGPDAAPDGYAMIETDITRLKREEAQKRELARQAYLARERLENALAAMPAAATVYDADERLVHWNPAFSNAFPEFARLFAPGITLEEIFRRAAAEGLFGDTGSAAEIEQRLAIYRCDQYDDEARAVDDRWFHRIHSRTEDGGIICLAIDITEQHDHIARLDSTNNELTAAIAERDEARERLDATMAAAEVGTWELDVAGGIITTGRHWAEMLGYGAELPATFPFDRLESMVHPDDRAKIYESPAFDPDFGAQMFEFEMRMLRRQGDWIWVLARGQVIVRDDKGFPLRVTGIHLDITERKKLIEELAASRQQMRLAMENSISAITLYDDQGRLTFANREAGRILNQALGTRIGNLDGEAEWRLETPDGRPVALEDTAFARVRRARFPVRNMRYTVCWPDGTRQALACNGTTLDLGDGRQGVALSFQDVTAQEGTMKALREALAHAEETSRAKSAFLANMSHEIRTPLNGVLGLAEVLEMQSRDATQKRLLASIRESGKTLLAVLNSILDIAKIESGKLELDAVPFSLADTINEIVPLHAVQAEEKGLDLSVFLAPDCARPVVGDPHRIRQIAHNLLNNAIKFTARGEVTLEVLCKPGRPVVIRVSDTGMGMTASESERVFEKFAQADSSVTRRHGGTGLGLPIVRELVTMMQGEIAVASTPGEGTTVTVTLPLQAADAAPEIAPPPATPAPAATRGHMGRLRILAADDNVTNRQVLSEMMAQLGVTVELAQDGQVALARWRAAIAAGTPFDAVLLDIAMPVLDGAGTLAAIREAEAREDRPPVFAVAVTGHAAPEVGAGASGSGFDARILKPCDLATLRAILERV